MVKQQERPHIVIVGAGFGGIRAATLLAKENVEVTLIDKQNYHLFQPLLYQVATAGLSEKDIVCPVRTIFRSQNNLDFRMDEVLTVDFVNKQLMTKTAQIKYDYLLLATGSTTNFFGLSSVAQNAFGIKTLGGSVRLRNQIIRMFELASHEEDEIKRHALLTFIVVGGGPTGVEFSGALSELIHMILAKEYHSLNFKEVRIVLVEASDGLLPGMEADLQEATVDALIRKKVEVRLLAQVSDFDGKTLVLKGEERIPTHTVIWAAGVCATSLMDGLNAEQDRARRVVVNDYLHLPGGPEVFVIGDAAHFRQDGEPLPMVAPVAVQQADTAVGNILSLIGQTPMKPFHYNSVGKMATVGRNFAVLHIGGFKSKGFVAWLIWSMVHVLRLVHFRNRTVVFMKWVWEYLTYERIEHVISQDDEAK
ncbi:MAG: NAD(P)/FAD-dependent oxidoreductase [Negativicutes bacterium]|nr:NAD(P)/FAD-dependent oxidoreductase [Negativicutes bacterium]